MALTSPQCVIELKSLSQSIARLQARAAFLEVRASLSRDTDRARLEWRRECEAFRSALEEIRSDINRFVENEPAAQHSPLYAFRDLQRGITHLTISAAAIADR